MNLSAFYQDRRSDLHVHLYGCLPLASLWQLGARRHQLMHERLDWFAREYEKIFQRRPEWQNYWQKSDGLDLLQKDILVTAPVNFARFQACFNLIIALFPPDVQDMSLLRAVLTADQTAKLAHVEYRTFLPPTWEDTALLEYLDALATNVAHFHSSSHDFSPTLALTLQRDLSKASAQYELLRHWQKTRPELAPFITGIDFCGYEENHDPVSLKPLLQKLRQDNDTYPPLEFLLHVGETFESLALFNSCRRVMDGALLGAHRLGHAVSLGLAPSLLNNRTVTENAKEWPAFVHWCSEHRNLLAEYGFDAATALPLLERHYTPLDDDYAQFTYTKESTEITAQLQEAGLRIVAETPAIIECCPTSNLRLTAVRHVTEHPLRRFRQHGLKVCIGRDDPGLFGNTLEDDHALASS